MSVDIFIKNKNEYKLDIDPLKQYVEQSAYYLSAMTGDPIEKCSDFILKSIKEKKFKGLRNPRVDYLERNENGDREEKAIGLKQYINTAISENLIMVPSGTCYLHPSVKESKYVPFMTQNKRNRAASKKAASIARAKKDMDLFINKNTEQKGLKTYNNTLSGTFGNSGTALFNLSAHYTLTSMTRSVSSYGNSNNERMLAGNRHYRTPDIAMFNIISVIVNTNLTNMQNIINKYNIHYPTVDETMEVILKSCHKYWKNHFYENKIFELVSRLTDIERAAYVYSGDLFHLKKFNESLVRTFLTKLIEIKENDSNNTIDEVKKFDEHIINLLHHMFTDELIGKGKDYEAVKKEGNLDKFISTGKNIVRTLTEYLDLIKTFIVIDSMPPSIAYIKGMHRDVTVLSDTDSTCATYQDWVKWYFGDIIFTSNAISLTGMVMTIVTQSIKHILMQFSANMNIDKKMYGVLNMKNEFYWDVMVPLNVSKHYYARARIQEGDVLDVLDNPTVKDLELKGAHLISSSSAKHVTVDSHKMILDICTSITTSKKLSLQRYISHVADLERQIYYDISHGKSDTFIMSQIKGHESYKKEPSKSPYINYILWNDVFKDKYGTIPNPPYTTIKISTNLINKTAIKEWLETIEDIELKNRLITWLNEHNKTSLKTILLSSEFVEANAIPDELLRCIDVDKIITNLCSGHYLVLESLGFYKEKKYPLMKLGY